MRQGCLVLVMVLCPAACWPEAASVPTPLEVADVGTFPTVKCAAAQTGGFHDYPEDEEHYEPALFHPSTFTLEENLVFMLNLDVGGGGPDLYLVMTGADGVTTELQCRRVRGVDDSFGYSCVNTPPSEMLLINGDTLRFTRTAVGGWTFAGAGSNLAGDSIFVEYGTCRPDPEPVTDPARAERRAP